MINESSLVAALSEMIPDSADIQDIAIVVTYSDGGSSSLYNPELTHAKSMKAELEGIVVEIDGSSAVKH